MRKLAAIVQALPYNQLWRKIAAESKGDEDDLGLLTSQTVKFFHEEFEKIRRDLGSTYAEILSRDSEATRSSIHRAINTAISWKSWNKLPIQQIESAFQGAYGLYLEVNNGGFHQFFFNSSGKYWPHILWGMDEAKDMNGVQRFTEVLSIFPNGQPSVSRQERWKQLEALEKWPWRRRKSRAHFELHSKRFFADPFPDGKLFWKLLQERLPDVSILWPT